MTIARTLAGVLAAGIMLSTSAAQGQVVRPGDSGAGVGMGSVTGDPAETIHAMRLRATKLIAEAQQLFTDTKYKSSWKKLKAARSLLVDKALAKQWKDLANQVNNVAKADATLAEQHYQKKEYTQAIKAYRRIWMGYSGLPVAKQASIRLKAIGKDPAVKATAQEDRAGKMFKIVRTTIDRQRKKLAAKAKDAKAKANDSKPTASAPAPPKAKTDAEIIASLSDERLLRTTDLLRRIVKTCSPAPTAMDCVDMLDALDADAPTSARLARLRVVRQAKRDLAQADMYRKAGMRAKAIELYRKILTDHRGTPTATQAAKHLGALGATVKPAPK